MDPGFSEVSAWNAGEAAWDTGITGAPDVTSRAVSAATMVARVAASVAGTETEACGTGSGSLTMAASGKGLGVSKGVTPSTEGSGEASFSYDGGGSEGCGFLATSLGV